MSFLEQRLQKMEKQLRLYRYVFSAMLITCGFLIFTAFNNRNQVPALLQAKEFQVVDDAGKVLVSIKKDYNAGNIRINNDKGQNIIHLLKSDAGTGALVTKTANGQFACRLIDYESGTGGLIEVYNKNDKLVGELGSTTNGGGYLGLKNNDEKTIGEMGSTDKNTGYLLVNNSDGKYMFRVTYTNTTNGGWMGMYNSTGNNILKLSTSKLGADISLMDNYEKERMSIGITDNNDGVISIYNRNSTRISVMGGTTNGDGALNVMNNSGQNMNGLWPKQ